MSEDEYRKESDELLREGERSKRLAIQLAWHLDDMGADKCILTVAARGRRFTVTVEVLP